MLRLETERVLSCSMRVYLTPSFTRASFPNSSPSWRVQTTPCVVCVCVRGGGKVLERKGNTSNGPDHLHSNLHTWGHTSLTHPGSHLPPLLTFTHTQGHTSLPSSPPSHTKGHTSLPLLTLPLMMTLTEPFRMIYQLPPLSPWWNTVWREDGMVSYLSVCVLMHMQVYVCTMTIIVQVHVHMQVSTQ